MNIPSIHPFRFHSSLVPWLVKHVGRVGNSSFVILGLHFKAPAPTISINPPLQFAITILLPPFSHAVSKENLPRAPLETIDGYLSFSSIYRSTVCNSRASLKYHWIVTEGL